MSRRFAILAFAFTFPAACAEPEKIPLLGWTKLIFEMQEQGKFADARGACDAALASADDPAAATAQQAKFFTTCGNLFVNSGELAKGRPLLETALRKWQETLGAAHCQVGTTSLDLALVHRLTGAYELSAQLARKAAGIYEACYGPQSSKLNALISLAVAETLLGRYADAESNLNRASSLLAPKARKNGPDAVPIFSGFGLLYLSKGRYLEAETSYRYVLQLSSNDSDAARGLAGLARVYLATGRYDKAATACSKALELLTRECGPDHPEVVITRQVFAEVRRRQKRYAEVQELLEQALDIVVRASDRNHLNESALLNSIGVSLFYQGRYVEAEATLRKSILIREKSGSAAGSEFAVALHNLARVVDRQGRHAEALELASRALAVREAELPDADSAVVEMMLHKAELLRKAHLKSEAAKLERAARQARAGQIGEDPQRWMVDYRDLQRK